MYKLLDLLRQKIEDLQEVETDCSVRDFLGEFLSAYNASDPTTYNQVTNTSYLLSLILATFDDVQMQELEEVAVQVQSFINTTLTDKVDEEEYETYLKLLFILNEKGMVVKNGDEIIINRAGDHKDYILYKDYARLKKHIFTYVEGNEKHKEFHSDVAKAFEKLFLTYPNVDIFMAMTCANYLAEEAQKLIDHIRSDDIKVQVIAESDCDISMNRVKNRLWEKFTDKQASQALSDIVKMGEEGAALTSNYNLIKAKHNKEQARLKNLVKDINKKLRKLDDLGSFVSHSENSEIVITNQVLDILYDLEVRSEFFKYAIKHNFVLFKKFEDLNKELSKNSVSKFELLFSDFGFNFNNFTSAERDSIISARSEEATRKILELVRTKELLFITEYIGEFAKLLSSSNLNIVKFIQALLKRNIIDKNFVLKNLEIIYDEQLFEVLYKNVNYLDSIGVNLFNLGKSRPDILLLDNQDIIIKTNILDEYGLKLDDKELYNFDVLDDDSLLDAIDNFIELGYGEIALHNPKYLNSQSSDIVKRVLICNLIGMSPVNSSNRFVGAVSTGNGFYVDPKNYDNYIIDYKLGYLDSRCVDVLNTSKRNIISNSTKHRTIVKLMDELFMSDRLTYIIAGISISRKRVMRNLEALLNTDLIDDFDIKELLYQAILYNMVCNVDSKSLEAIYTSIMNIQIETDKIYSLK